MLRPDQISQWKNHIVTHELSFPVQHLHWQDRWQIGTGKRPDDNMPVIKNRFGLWGKRRKV